MACTVSSNPLNALLTPKLSCEFHAKLLIPADFRVAPPHMVQLMEQDPAHCVSTASRADPARFKEKEKTFSFVYNYEGVKWAE